MPSPDASIEPSPNWPSGSFCSADLRNQATASSSSSDRSSICPYNACAAACPASEARLNGAIAVTMSPARKAFLPASKSSADPAIARGVRIAIPSIGKIHLSPDPKNLRIGRLLQRTGACMLYRSEFMGFGAAARRWFDWMPARFPLPRTPRASCTGWTIRSRVLRPQPCDLRGSPRASCR